jgi:hypothetical protein
VNIYLNILLVFLCVSVVSIGCSKMNKSVGLKDDNVCEEVIELIIENETGLDFDLTPLSPE